MAVVGCIVIAIGAVLPADPVPAAGLRRTRHRLRCGAAAVVVGRRRHVRASSAAAGSPAGSSAATQSAATAAPAARPAPSRRPSRGSASAMGAFGAACRRVTSIAHRAADIGSDVLGQAGVGSPGYSMTPTDERQPPRHRAPAAPAGDDSAAERRRRREPAAGGGTPPEPPDPADATPARRRRRRRRRRRQPAAPAAAGGGRRGGGLRPRRSRRCAMTAARPARSATAPGRRTGRAGSSVSAAALGHDPARRRAAADRRRRAPLAARAGLDAGVGGADRARRRPGARPLGVPLGARFPLPLRRSGHALDATGSPRPPPAPSRTSTRPTCPGVLSGIRTHDGPPFGPLLARPAIVADNRERTWAVVARITHPGIGLAEVAGPDPDGQRAVRAARGRRDRRAGRRCSRCRSAPCPTTAPNAPPGSRPTCARTPRSWRWRSTPSWRR